MRSALLFVAACGSAPLDRPIDDASIADSQPDGATADLSYISLASGWKVDVYRDVTALIPYIPSQFIDGTEIYDNSIAMPFVVQGTQGNGLGICAGRDILILDADAFALHDYGEHVPNTTNFPDGIQNAVWVNNQILLSSSSLNGGDGLFTIAADWSISRTYNDNNMRVVVSDPAGVFDAFGTPQIYIGDIVGVYRYGTTPNEIKPAFDASSLAVNGPTLIYTNRTSDTATDLYSVTSTQHTSTLLASSTSIGIGEGPPLTAGALGWAIVDAAKIDEVDPNTTGNLTQVAQTTDLNYQWTGVTMPPATHPLGRALYVTENNRVLNQERVLRFSHQ